MPHLLCYPRGSFAKILFVKLLKLTFSGKFSDTKISWYTVYLLWCFHVLQYSTHKHIRISIRTTPTIITIIIAIIKVFIYSQFRHFFFKNDNFIYTKNSSNPCNLNNNDNKIII